MRPSGERRRALHHMTPTDLPPLESNRAYRYLLVVELVLSIAFLGLSIAAYLGLL